MSDTDTVSPRARLILAVAQLGVIAGLAWLWTGTSTDASATTVDWAFVGITVATPLVLAVSGWIGSRVRRRRRSRPAEPRTTRRVALIVQWITLGLVAFAILVAPLAVFGALVFGPMG